MGFKHPETALRCARLALGLSQSELGRRVGMSGTKYAKFEHGKITPKPFEAQLISKELGITMSDLFDGGEA